MTNDRRIPSGQPCAKQIPKPQAFVRSGNYAETAVSPHPLFIQNNQEPFSKKKNKTSRAHHLSSSYSTETTTEKGSLSFTFFRYFFHEKAVLIFHQILLLPVSCYFCNFGESLRLGLQYSQRFEGYSGSDYCGLDLSLAKLSFSPGRKNLQKEVKEEPKTHDAGQNFHPREEKNYSGSLSTTKKVGIAATGLFVMSCALLCPCFYKKRKATAHTVLARDPNSMDSASSLDVNSGSEKVSGADKVPPSPMRVPPSPSRFTMSPKLNRIGSVHLNMSQVVKATRNFSPSLRIGEGGFGTVYKAQLEDGLLVAIKRAKKEQFENLQTEFSSEVELLSKIDHRNLVKLLGFVDKGNERLIITEFVPNGTLREHLDGQYGKTLDFNQRLEIAIDVAHGLTYLHLYAEKQIIHRDVKSSNILLTESMRAKVADFGFARLGPMDSDRTHISTKVKGTVGYLDPEYMKTYQLTTKSDVYSFGVLLLEILTGRRPVELKRPPEERVTLRWAFKRYNEGNLLDMVDPSIKEVISMEILTKMFGLAIQCAAPIRNDRPDMKSVGEQLWTIRADSLKSVKKG